MKKILLFSCVAFALIFASCKSTGQDTSNSLVDSSVAANDSEKENPEDADNLHSSDKDFLSQTEEARKKALEAGANEAYPEAFAALDAAYDALKNLDGVNIDADLLELKLRYEALEKAAKARALKKRIDDEDLARNSPADYEKGENALKEFESLLGDVLSNVRDMSENLKKSHDSISDVKNAVGAPSKNLVAKAGEAYDSYYKVYFVSYKKFANEERKNALAQKKKADAVRAQISRKQEYKEYAELIQKGDSQYSTLNPEGAYNSYKKAASSFEVLAADVAEKRAAAQKAIDEAKAKVKESSDYALNADKVNPLEEKVEGIEDENAVLLEADNFENPDNEIILFEEISETDLNSEIGGVNAGGDAR